MGDQARVTVVIPAYKAEATIRRAVDSVLAQEGVEVETIVVVDGRLDRTAEMLAGYDPERVRVIVQEENEGAQASRNRGLEAASGEWVMFLDCDDFVEGPLLRGLAHSLRDAPADIAFAPMQRIREPGGKRLAVVRRDYRSADDLFRAWLGRGETLNPSAIMWRTDFLRRIGGWDVRARRNQDGEVVMRSVLSGARFALSSEGRGMYVLHESADRVTRRPENLPSALEVGEYLMAIPTTAVSDEARREGFAGYFYRIALRLHSLGRPDLAARAWRRASEAGLRPGLLARGHRWIARLVGLPFRLGLARLDSDGIAVWLLLGLAGRNIGGAVKKGRLKIAAAEGRKADQPEAGAARTSR